MSYMNKEEAFDEVGEALAGQRFELTGGASKVLHFMLERPEGCDASITRERFEIRFGWNPSLHPYFTELAPAVVSQLLEWAGIFEPTQQVRTVLGPSPVPAGEFPAWSFGRRRLWLDATGEAVLIRIRDGSNTEGSDIGEPPEPIPEPRPYTRSFLELAEARPCPRCSASSARYRQLSDGFLVCAKCGCSFGGWA